MYIDTHTHITLTAKELKEIIINKLKSDGYSVIPGDIDFVIGGDPYEPLNLQSCKIIARKEVKIK